MAQKTRLRHLLSIGDLTRREFEALLDAGTRHKQERRQGRTLDGKSIALLFEKPSTRTRVSFEVAIRELGGHPLVLGWQETQLGRGEPVEDVARVLSRYVHLLVARVRDHRSLDAMARTATVPVVNALSDREHPCQALADMLTLRENLGDLRGIRLAWVGDGNNVCHSLLLAAGHSRMEVRVASPGGYTPRPRVVAQARRLGAKVTLAKTPEEAARGTDALYTDVWVSMGQETDAEKRRLAFQGYSITSPLLRRASPGAIVLHCLPAHRGEEITRGVLEGPRSRVWDQAENRMHAQKAVLEFLLRKNSS